MSSTTGTAADLDRILDTLSNRRRRHLLGRLADAEAGTSVQIATVARGEQDGEQLVRLHHSHLPKLEEAGYIEWDRDVDAIRRGDRFDRIEPLVRLLQENTNALPVDWP